MPIEQRSNSTSRSSFDPTDETINNAVSTIENRDLESIIDSNTNKEELDTAIAGVGGGGVEFATDAEALSGLLLDRAINPVGLKYVIDNITVVDGVDGIDGIDGADGADGSSTMSSYTTGSRPAHVSGLTIIDSTLGYPIYSDGTNWRDFTGAIPYTATVFFSEDFESGLNSWNLVADPSAGVYTNQDVTLAGAVATKYNQTYAELSFRGRISSLGVIDDSYFDYKTYSYDAGGGTWYIVINNFNNGDWIVRESSVDPSSFANGTDLGISLDSEQVAAFSVSRDGENAPFPAGLVSGYSGGTFTATNSWEIGSALSNGGTSSVYISEDEGTSSSYDNTIPTVAHAYKEFTVPAESTGTITLNFDWKCLGETTYDFVRVFVAPTGTVTPTGGSEVGFQYNVVSSTGRYSNSDSWTSASEDITSLVSVGSTYKLIIQWKNDNVGGSGDVAVDNISIFY